FANGEKLLQRQIRFLQRRTNQAIASSVTERRQSAAGGAAECSTVVPAIGRGIVHPPVAKLIGPLCSDGAAGDIGRSRTEWTAGLQRHNPGQLPSANQSVERLGCAVKVPVTFSNRDLQCVGTNEAVADVESRQATVVVIVLWILRAAVAVAA